MNEFIEIDGSEGEGGGQILRSALALSLITGRTFRLVNIRANRPKPGLAAQHLACVRAAAMIGGAQYKGGAIGSSTLVFEPGRVKSGNYSFAIGTAGATGLVLHTVALPLALSGTSTSRVTITGGTHVAHSPSFHFNQTTWSGYWKHVGLGITLEMIRPGFYPRGGGEIMATIEPCATLRGLTLTSSPEITTAGGFAAVTGLPDSIAREMARRLKHRMAMAGIDSHIVEENWSEGRGSGPGAVCGVVFRQQTVPAVFVGLGERGKPGGVVADEAADEALRFRENGGVVDPHSADQLVLTLAFAKQASEFRTSEVTRHLLTNIETIRRFVDVEIRCEGSVGRPGTVRVIPGERFNRPSAPE